MLKQLRESKTFLGEKSGERLCKKTRWGFLSDISSIAEGNDFGTPLKKEMDRSNLRLRGAGGGSFNNKEGLEITENSESGVGPV